jgi:hypothetical protein
MAACRACVVYAGAEAGVVPDATACLHGGGARRACGQFERAEFARSGRQRPALGHGLCLCGLRQLLLLLLPLLPLLLLLLMRHRPWLA